MASEYDDQPISRTYQYRKVMKPMLERKRRARINRCLDELKELMVGALEAEGENVNKLEKADVLELTVRHLHKLRRQQALGLTPEADYADRFRAGFTHCAAEVSGFLTSVAGVDVAVSTRLLSHLGACIRQIEGPPAPVAHNQGGIGQIMQPVAIPPNHPSQNHQIPGTYTPPTSPVSTPTSTTSEHVTSTSPNPFPSSVQGHYTIIPLPLTSRLEQVGRPSVVVRSPIMESTTATSKRMSLPYQDVESSQGGCVWRPW